MRGRSLSERAAWAGLGWLRGKKKTAKDRYEEGMSGASCMQGELMHGRAIYITQ